MKRILTVISAVSVIAIAIVLAEASRPYRSTLAGGPATAHCATAEQAEYMTRLADCVACHSVPGEKPFAGGLAMGSPLGTIYATNITPDTKTGIGGYSLAEFDDAVRHGIAKDGHRLYPAMPYPSYAKLSDEDVKRLYQYFIESVPPVDKPNKLVDIRWPLSTRWPLAIWNLVFTDAKPFTRSAAHDEFWNRGAYLVEGAGHCGSCHTPRGVVFEEMALTAENPKFLAGALLDGWKASSLRGEADVGLGRWSEADIVTFLKNGHNVHASVFGSMLDAFNNSTQYMSTDDVGAIAHFLKSLPSTGGADRAYIYDPKATETLQLGEAKLSGAQQYLRNCVWCHGLDGRGQGFQLSALAGNPNVIDPDPDSVINIILNGAGRVVKNGEPDTYRMSPFRVLMSDAEIAAVASFVRSGWGNSARAVSDDQVRNLKVQTNAASDQVVILKMR